MRSSFRARVSSSSRASGSEQGLRIKKSSQRQQSSDGNARTGFFAQEAAGVGIEHPGRNGQDRAVRQLDDVTFFGQAPKASHDLAYVIKKRMMPVAYSHRRR
jgi:hypothetical protein